MALPKLTTPTYELEIPSTDEKIKYRPFLVKEEKILMMAMESKENADITQAVKDIVSECTFNKVKIDDMPMFDVEYIFLQIRSKSVGEVSKLKLLCPDDEETYTQTEINLDEIDVQMTEGHTNETQLTDTIKLVMKYPQLADMRGVQMKGDSQISQVFSILKHCIWEVHDGETIYNRVDISDKDIEDFVDSFDTGQFEKVMEFFNTMPKLRHSVEITNPKTKVKSMVTIEGLESFLG